VVHSGQSSCHAISGPLSKGGFPDRVGAPSALEARRHPDPDQIALGYYTSQKSIPLQKCQFSPYFQRKNTLLVFGFADRVGAPSALEAARHPDPARQHQRWPPHLHPLPSFVPANKSFSICSIQICINKMVHIRDLFPPKTGRNETRLLADPTRQHRRWPPHLHPLPSFVPSNKSLFICSIQICIHKMVHICHLFPSKTGRNETRLPADPARQHRRWPPHLHAFPLLEPANQHSLCRTTARCRLLGSRSYN